MQKYKLGFRQSVRGEDLHHLKITLTDSKWLCVYKIFKWRHFQRFNFVDLTHYAKWWHFFWKQNIIFLGCFLGYAIFCVYVLAVTYHCIPVCLSIGPDNYRWFVQAPLVQIQDDIYTRLLKRFCRLVSDYSQSLHLGVLEAHI